MKWQTPREATFCAAHAITAVSHLMMTLISVSVHENKPSFAETQG